MSTLLILMLSLGSILIGNLVRFPLGVLKGQGHVARGIRWESLFILIDGLIIFFGLYFKIRPAELAALLFLFDLILYTAFKQIEERSLNIAFPEQRQSVDLDLLKPFMTLITGSLSSGLAFSLLNQGLTQVVFLNLGASVTVLFNTLRTLVRSLLLPINLLAAGIRYDLTRAYANRDQELQQRLYFHTLRITQLFLMIGIVTLFFGGEWLLKTWTRNQVTWNSSLFNLLLISMLFASFSGLANQLLYSANQFIRISSWQLGLLIPMVVLGLLRFWPKTPNALGTGFLINEFFFAVVSLLCVRKVFHISWRALIKNLLSFPTYSEILRYLIFPFRR